MDSLADRVSRCPTATVDGVWQRHVPARYAASALEGRQAQSRWGTEDGFPILHLGRPRSSVVVEAYRHLVDPVVDAGEAARMVAPRVMVTCRLAVTDVLDLRTSTARVSTDLDLTTLQSDVTDNDAYERCQVVAAVAHQLGLHGVVAPAATQLGETLAVFVRLIGEAERPLPLDEESWLTLPADPRRERPPHLQVVR